MNVRGIKDLCVSLFAELRAAVAYRAIPVSAEDSYILRGFKWRDLPSVRRLYRDLNPEGRLSWLRLVIGLLSYRKLLLVIENSDRDIVGIDLFYFNVRDVSEATVHEGFVGVSEAYRGLGLATKMRVAAKGHFKRNGLAGISTRIAQDNPASLLSALKSGFEIVETHVSNNVDNHYMVCSLGDNK
ncbi:GNAT family N-acetyltransferase [Pseudomonas entomophila]|uniref:GNAT family N-acetyltransferase n=1 Tax=Pseudomonas entomophila TaxID=312306 RepID=UPI001BD168CD|nr:GNAT family N-acetyltransferase [Pseudomonas entomophila]QVM92792.1 GNAT family N-acetyltransferase [Pseudomonas entomophila]